MINFMKIKKKKLQKTYYTKGILFIFKIFYELNIGINSQNFILTKKERYKRNYPL